MNNPRTLSEPVTRRVLTTLTLPGLIRLVSEIDDHGPVGRGSLGVTFDDLSRHQLRHALDTARALGVIETDDHAPARYRLTEDGENLAEVYDRAARWARTHQYPSSSSDFITRVQRTLQLPVRLPGTGEDQRSTPDQGVATGFAADPSAGRDLEAIQAALVEWTEAGPQTAHAVQAENESDHAA